MDEQILSIERYGGNRENLIEFDPSEQADRKKIKSKKIALVAGRHIFLIDQPPVLKTSAELGTFQING